MQLDTSLLIAAKTHTTDPRSQMYLWILSRLDTAKVVHRSIQAATTTEQVKMVVAEYNIWDKLPYGVRIHDAFDAYRGAQQLREMVPGACAYVRRKPTSRGLSPTRYQIVLLWNCYCNEC